MISAVIKNPVLEKITQRGYWKIVIRPGAFRTDRISSLRDCEEIVERLAVHKNGWAYPIFYRDQNLKRSIDYIEYALDFERYQEFWRYYQSGQFVSYTGLREDWGMLREPLVGLEIGYTVYILTWAYEFAARLAIKEYLGEEICIAITLVNNTNERYLVNVDPKLNIFSLYGTKTGLPELPYEKTYAKLDLLGGAADLALDHAMWLFERFGWQALRPLLKEEQRRFLEGKFA